MKAHGSDQFAAPHKPAPRTMGHPPLELSNLLEAVRTGAKPERTEVFRFNRRREFLRATVGIALGILLLYFSLFVFSSSGGSTFARIAFGAFGGLALFAGLPALMHATRHRPEVFLLISPDFVANTASPKGLQWFATKEIAHVSCIWKGWHQRLAITLRDGEVEPVVTRYELQEGPETWMVEILSRRD
jgi:hypothetical protein